MAGKPWRPREDSNPSLIVRSDLSFPIERRGQKSGRAGPLNDLPSNKTWGGHGESNAGGEVHSLPNYHCSMATSGARGANRTLMIGISNRRHDHVGDPDEIGG